MKQLEVKILQQSYLLGCQEGQEARLLEAAARVDEAMTRIHDAGKVRARERIAVLAALNLAFELDDLTQEVKDLKSRTVGTPVSDLFGEGAVLGEHGLPSIDPELEQRQLRDLLSRIDHALQK